MDVRAVPNPLRPGAGHVPARENRRAWLPQQTRFCPVVEDVNKLGFLVYPPLEDHEALQLRAGHDDTLTATFLAADELGEYHPAFEAHVDAAGTIAMTVVDADRIASEAAAHELLEAVVVDLNQPSGTVGLRGAYGFATPAGWDTLFTSVFNDLPRPIVPALSTRLATDGTEHHSVFWYTLRPGQVLGLAGGSPIGQAFFLPREDIELIDGTPEEEQRFVEVQRDYWAERATKEKTTNYGATFTYHYRDHQKARRAGAPDALGLLQDGHNGAGD